MMTRKQFLLATTALAGAGAALAAETAPPPRVLLVVAHPDDEYAFAATVYRISKELGGTVDQVVITDGAGGYRYSSLAERVYGVALTTPGGRESPPQIRRRETLAAGRILGIRKHYFLDQKDAGFTLDPGGALNELWNAGAMTHFVSELLRRVKYQFVFTLLPDAETHGHHRAATLLALKAVESQPPETRPVLFGADPGSASAAAPAFTGDPLFPDLKAFPGTPVFAFDRRKTFGFNGALSYQIMVNWMIAEHNSQGLFQTDFNRHDLE
jgi:LmbE family N-acetylglucosaminyl deacetylase